MSLNSVVNSLVRAAAGIPTEISDADLDRHVADLLAAEAKQRELKWSELGLSGLLGGTGRDSPDPSLPRPNKRFLASVIRTVDGHNNALLRAQAQASRDARDERRGETSRSGAGRLLGGALRDMGSGSVGLGRSRRDAEDRYRMKGEAERAARGVERRQGDGEYHSQRRGRKDRIEDGDRLAEHLSFRDRGRERDEDGHSKGDVDRPSRRQGEDGTHRTHRDTDRRNVDAKEHSSRAHRRYSDTEAANDGRRQTRLRGDAMQDADDNGHRRHHRSDRRPSPDGIGDDHRHHKRADNDDDDAEATSRSHIRVHELYEDDGREHKKLGEHTSRESEHRSTRHSRHKIGMTDNEQHINRSQADEQRSRGSTEHLVESTPPKSSHFNDEVLIENRSKPEPSRRHGHCTSRPAPLKPSPPSERPPPPPDEPVPPLPPSPDHPRLSKMDRYFSREYDPRLDVGEVPKEGMIAAVGWDNMLAVLKERGHKKRRHSPGLSDSNHDVPTKHVVRSPPADSSATQLEKAEKKKRKEAKEKRLGEIYDPEEEKEREKRKDKRRKEKEALASLGAATNGGVDVFGVKYVPKGGIREWDLGK